MNHEAEAFFVASSHRARALFMTYFGGSNDEGFVLCNPAPQDMMRAGPSQILLAKKLQELGFPTLRFDYTGTGDSSGTIIDLAQWKQDLLEAVQTLRKKSGVHKISLIGTRLGATLALLVSQEIGFKRLLLWDPILDGEQLLREYRDAHHHILHRVPVEAPYPENQVSPDQSCGYFWPYQIREDIASITPRSLTTFCKDISVVVHELSPELDQLLASWRAEGKEADLFHEGDDMRWGHHRLMTMQAFPAASIRILTHIAVGR
ncbi:MAG: hypothetical protein H7249_06410 [Chitinophagaceae bacterium]|nr:hypothetical protein [Oligoflexus sp.]